MDDDLFDDWSSLATEDDDDIDDALEALLTEDDEARRRRGRRRRPVRTGSGANYYRPRPQRQYVTQPQLQSALARSEKDVKANASAIKTVNGRLGSLSSDQQRHASLLKREVAARKKETEKLKGNLQMATLLPLLSTGGSVTTTTATEIGGATVPAGTRLQTAPDSFSALLPLLLLGDGLGGGGDSSSGLLLALVLSQKK